MLVRKGLYFLKPRNEELKSGYIGISGKVKSDDPEGKGLIKRLFEHLWTGDWGHDGTGADNSFIESIIADWEFGLYLTSLNLVWREKAQDSKRQG